MDRRLWPSTFPATSIRPASSGPLWATRASMREAVSGSMPPYPPTIPHMSLHSTPGSGTLATVDVTPGRKGCRCYSRTGTFRPYPLIFSHLADLARARVGLKWLYLYCEPCHGIMRRGGGYGGGHSRGLPRWRGAGWRATRRFCRGSLNLSPKPGDPEGNLLLAEKEIAAALVLEPSLRYVVLPELKPRQGAWDLHRLRFPRRSSWLPRGRLRQREPRGPRERGCHLPQAQPGRDDPGAPGLHAWDGVSDSRGRRVARLARRLLGHGFPRDGQGGRARRGRSDPGPSSLARAVGFPVRPLVRRSRPRQRRLRREREPDRRLPGSQLRNPGPRLRPRRDARVPLLRCGQHKHGRPRNLPALASPLRQHGRKGRRGGAAGDRLLKPFSKRINLSEKGARQQVSLEKIA